MKTMKKVLAILTLLTLVLSCTAAFADGKSVGSDVNVPAENTETIKRGTTANPNKRETRP